MSPHGDIIKVARHQPTCNQPTCNSFIFE